MNFAGLRAAARFGRFGEMISTRRCAVRERRTVRITHTKHKTEAQISQHSGYGQALAQPFTDCECNVTYVDKGSDTDRVLSERRDAGLFIYV